jgi:hypothetical protein
MWYVHLPWFRMWGLRCTHESKEFSSATYGNLNSSSKSIALGFYSVSLKSPLGASSQLWLILAMMHFS